MLRGKRILLNRIKSLKSTAKMYRAAARQAEIDRDFAIERVKEVNAENRRLKARIRGAEALYGAAMQRVEDLEKELGMRSEETEREIESPQPPAATALPGENVSGEARA